MKYKNHHICCNFPTTPIKECKLCKRLYTEENKSKRKVKLERILKEK